MTASALAQRQGAPKDDIGAGAVSPAPERMTTRLSAPPFALSVSRLRLTAFRNYEAALVETDRRPIVLTGPNGAGKTNLLEAVSLLAPGRGLRRARVPDMDRKVAGNTGAAAPSWSVAATVETPAGPVQIGTGRDPEGDRRLVRIDGEAARGQTALGDHFSAVWLTPQMDRLFLDSAGERRRFLDRLIFGFDGAHAGRINAYEKAMRQRSRVLKDGIDDPAWLNALEDQMTERAIAIAAARRDMIGRLGRACARDEGPFPGAALSVEGDVESWLSEMPAVDAEERFADALRSSRSRDAEAGGAAIGPHRSDLAVTHLAKDMPAAHCSTGEQKALLIAIVLAHARLQGAERGAGPVLLMDEVAAHLDEDRRNALFDTVLSLGLQAWITGTDAAAFAGLSGKARFFDVAAATVQPADL